MAEVRVWAPTPPPPIPTPLVPPLPLPLLLPTTAGVIANIAKLVQLLLADMSGVELVERPNIGELGNV